MASLALTQHLALYDAWQLSDKVRKAAEALGDLAGDGKKELPSKGALQSASLSQSRWRKGQRLQYNRQRLVISRLGTPAIVPASCHTVRVPPEESSGPTFSLEMHPSDPKGGKVQHGTFSSMSALLERLDLESKEARKAGHKVLVRIIATVLVIAPTAAAHEAANEQRMVLGVILKTQLPLLQPGERCGLCDHATRGLRPLGAEHGPVHAACIPLWLREAVKVPGTWHNLGHDEAEPANLHHPSHDLDLCARVPFRLAQPCIGFQLGPGRIGDAGLATSQLETLCSAVAACMRRAVGLAPDSPQLQVRAAEVGNSGAAFHPACPPLIANGGVTECTTTQSSLQPHALQQELELVLWHSCLAGPQTTQSMSHSEADLQLVAGTPYRLTLRMPLEACERLRRLGAVKLQSGQLSSPSGAHSGERCRPRSGRKSLGGGNIKWRLFIALFPVGTTPTTLRALAEVAFLLEYLPEAEAQAALAGQELEGYTLEVPVHLPHQTGLELCVYAAGISNVSPAMDEVANGWTGREPLVAMGTALTCQVTQQRGPLELLTALNTSLLKARTSNQAMQQPRPPSSPSTAVALIGAGASPRSGGRRDPDGQLWPAIVDNVLFPTHLLVADAGDEVRLSHFGKATSAQVGAARSVATANLGPLLPDPPPQLTVLNACGSHGHVSDGQPVLEFKHVEASASYRIECLRMDSPLVPHSYFESFTPAAYEEVGAALVVRLAGAVPGRYLFRVQARSCAPGVGFGPFSEYTQLEYQVCDVVLQRKAVEEVKLQVVQGLSADPATLRKHLEEAMRHGVDEDDALIRKARDLLARVETAQHRAQVEQAHLQKLRVLVRMRFRPALENALRDLRNASVDETLDEVKAAKALAVELRMAEEVEKRAAARNAEALQLAKDTMRQVLKQHTRNVEVIEAAVSSARKAGMPTEEPCMRAAIHQLKILRVSRGGTRKGEAVDIPAKQVRMVEGQRKALVKAARLGEELIIKLLLKDRASPDATDDRGVSAVALAMVKKRTRIVTLLLTARANANIAATDSGTTPLMLCKGDASGCKLQKLLLEFRADVHVRDSLGRTALHHAAERHESKLVEALLDADAEPDSLDKSLWTPLGYALHGPVAKQNSQAVHLLRKSLAQIEQDESFSAGMIRWSSLPDLVPVKLSAPIPTEVAYQPPRSESERRRSSGYSIAVTAPTVDTASTAACSKTAVPSRPAKEAEPANTFWEQMQRLAVVEKEEEEETSSSSSSCSSSTSSSTDSDEDDERKSSAASSRCKAAGQEPSQEGKVPPESKQILQPPGQPSSAARRRNSLAGFKDSWQLRAQGAVASQTLQDVLTARPCTPKLRRSSLDGAVL